MGRTNPTSISLSQPDEYLVSDFEFGNTGSDFCHNARAIVADFVWEA